MKQIVRELSRWTWGEGDQARALTTVLPVIAMIIMSLLLLVLGLILTKTTRESAQNEAGNRLAAEAKTFAALLDQSISAELADLQSKAASFAALQLHREPDKINAWIDAIEQKIHEYNWVGFADREGIIKASSGNLLAGQSVAEREWFRQGLLSAVTIDLHEAKLLEPFLPARADGPWRFIDLAVPLRAGDEILGVIGAHLSWDWLMSLQKKFAATLPLPRQAEVFVAGADGTIRLSDLSFENWRLHELSSFQNAASGMVGWTREVWADGNQYIVGFANASSQANGHQLAWITLIRVPAQSFEATTAHAVNGIWALVAATIALFYVGIRALLRVTLSPVKQLVLQVREVAKHGGRVDLSAHAPREFRALGEATNQMIQSLEASQSADIAKSRFLADMSHEVRTLLHGMLSHWELARLGQDPVQREKDLEKSMGYGKELITLVNDLLDLSAIEEGKLRLDRTPVYIAELVRSNALLYEGPAKAKGLGFVVDIQVEDTLQIMTDPLRLGQILRNLFSNAVKFTAQGSISVSVELQETPLQHQLRIGVRDTGLGLSQSQQEMVFGRFEQTDPALGAKVGGSGLGLSLSQILTKAIGGEMVLRSASGEGSEFIVLLPIEVGPNKIGAKENRALPNTKTQLRVLCVDDLKDNRTVLCRWLSIHGHAPHEAENGTEAIEKAAQQSFDLILMDIDLPDMPGTDAIRTIRSTGSASANAVIYTVSGHAYDADVNRSLAAGSDGHISKPIDFRLLEEKLGQLDKDKDQASPSNRHSSGSPAANGTI
jgi:signal transduction histidine kinase/ActR/RegA family two-component response regulator